MKPAFGTGTTVKSEKVADVAVPSEPEGLVTGGSISPDGRRVMLCDLKGGYELVLPEGTVDPRIAVGTALTSGPPRRSQRAELPHWAPASGSGVEAHGG